MVHRRILELAGESLESMLREGFSYLTEVFRSSLIHNKPYGRVEVCKAEHQLFFQYFTEEEGPINALVAEMENLGTILYETVRPRLISEYSLDNLCTYVSILKFEVVDQIDKYNT